MNPPLRLEVDIDEQPFRNYLELLNSYLELCEYPIHGLNVPDEIVRSEYEFEGDDRKKLLVRLHPSRELLRFGAMISREFRPRDLRSDVKQHP